MCECDFAVGPIGRKWNVFSLLYRLFRVSANVELKKEAIIAIAVFAKSREFVNEMWRWIRCALLLVRFSSYFLPTPPSLLTLHIPPPLSHSPFSHQNFEVLRVIETEYRQEVKYLDRHSLTLAFVKLLSVLFSQTDPSLLSSSSERRGVEKAIDFVRILRFCEDVFAALPDLKCEREHDRWRLCKLCLQIFRSVVTCYVPKYDLLKGGKRLAEPHSPGLHLMDQFLSCDSPILRRLKHVLVTAAVGEPLDPNQMEESEGGDEVVNRGLSQERDVEWGYMYEEAVAASLSLTLAILLKQKDHFDVVRVVDNPPSAFQPFHSLLLSFIGSVASFVNYQFNEEICLNTLRILDYVSVHASPEELVRHIPNREGFYESFQHRLLTEDPSGDSESDAEFDEFCDIYAERHVQSAAVRLLLNSLHLRGLNLSLFLLGFRRNTNSKGMYVLMDVSTLEEVIVLATAAAPHPSTLSLPSSSSSSSSSSSASPPSPSARSNLGTLCLDLLTRLCSASLTSAAVLSHLRTVKEFPPLMSEFQTISQEVPATVTYLAASPLSSSTLLPELHSLIRNLMQMALYWRIVAADIYAGEHAGRGGREMERKKRECAFVCVCV